MKEACPKVAMVRNLAKYQENITYTKRNRYYLVRMPIWKGIARKIMYHDFKYANLNQNSKGTGRYLLIIFLKNLFKVHIDTG
jgi:hypothetical protein